MLSRKSSSSLFSTAAPSVSITLALLVANCSLMSSQAVVAMLRLSLMSLAQLASFRVQSGGSAVGRMLLQMDLGLEHLGSSEIQPEMVEDTAIGPDLSHQLHSYLARIAWYSNLKVLSRQNIPVPRELHVLVG